MPTATQTSPLASRFSIKKKAFMTAKNTVSEDAIQAEWEEVQLAQQNPAMFRPLYSRYYEPIFRFIFRRTSDEMLTGDLCAQVFLKAMQKIKKYQLHTVFVHALNTLDFPYPCHHIVTIC